MAPYKGEALISQETFCRLKNDVMNHLKMTMKTILSDAESHEEHDATKYSPIG